MYLFTYTKRDNLGTHLAEESSENSCKRGLKHSYRLDYFIFMGKLGQK